MPRSISPGAEELLDREFPALNLGYVQPIDYMGNDNDIVQAARVSYGPSTKPKSDDRGLLRYLMWNRHTTPLEMCEVKFRCKMPIFVARQWIRHRTACLTGDTVLQFDLPGGLSRRGSQLYTLSVEEVWNRFQPTQNTSRPERQKHAYFRRDRVQGMLLRSVDESTGRVRHTKIVDIWESGEKQVYEVVTRSGHKATMSADHLCLTSEGWKKLKEIVDLESVVGPLRGVQGHVIPSMMVVGPGCRGVVPHFNEVDPTTESWLPVRGWEDLYEISDQGRVRRVVGGRGVRAVGSPKKLTRSGSHAVVSLSREGCTFTYHVHRLMMLAFSEGEPTPNAHIRHLDGNGLNNLLENLAWGTSQENADDRVLHGATTALAASLDDIESITYVGVRPTYDLEVEGPWHNFSAGGLIVHNSVNEMSLRYTEAPDEFYVPALEQITLQSSTNKQGRAATQLDPEVQARVAERLARSAQDCHALYEELASELGIAKELARTCLPVSLYTQWIWKIDLHNLLHFLGLRLDEHAQWEIRQFAEAMATFVKAWVPLTWEAFEDYRLKGVNLSAHEHLLIQRVLDGHPITKEDLAPLSQREVVAFQKKFPTVRLPA